MSAGERQLSGETLRWEAQPADAQAGFSSGDAASTRRPVARRRPEQPPQPSPLTVRPVDGNIAANGSPAQPASPCVAGALLLCGPVVLGCGRLARMRREPCVTADRCNRSGRLTGPVNPREQRTISPPPANPITDSEGWDQRLQYSANVVIAAIQIMNVLREIYIADRTRVASVDCAVPAVAR